METPANHSWTKFLCWKTQEATLSSSAPSTLFSTKAVDPPFVLHSSTFAPRTWFCILIDHVFVIYSSSADSSCQCDKSLECSVDYARQCQEKRTVSCLDTAGLSPPQTGSKRAAETSRCSWSDRAPWVISVTNAFGEQIVAVACLVQRVAVLLWLWGFQLIRVMDDSATGPIPLSLFQAWSTDLSRDAENLVFPECISGHYGRQVHVCFIDTQ